MIKGISKFLAAGLLLLVGSANAALLSPLTVNTLIDGSSDLANSAIGTSYEVPVSYDFTTTTNLLLVTATLTPGGPLAGEFEGRTYSNMSWTVDGTTHILTPHDGYLNPGATLVDSFLLDLGETKAISIAGTYNDLAGYNLVVTAEISEVPVPGAAILFGSAVVAFGFVSRRRKGMSA